MTMPLMVLEHSNVRVAIIIEQSPIPIELAVHIESFLDLIALRYSSGNPLGYVRMFCALADNYRILYFNFSEFYGLILEIKVFLLGSFKDFFDGELFVHSPSGEGTKVLVCFENLRLRS